MRGADGPLDAGGRYLTYTMSGEGNCCPGFMHILRCLNALIELGSLSRRKVILPPPWLVLSEAHNFSPLRPQRTPLAQHFDWGRYLNLDALVGSGLLEPPSRRVHVSSGNGGARVPLGVLMSPATSWPELRDANDTLLALRFAPKWDLEGKRHATDCARGEIGGRKSHPVEAPVRMPTLDTPSALVAGLVSRAAKRLGRFAMLHIRRGRAVTGASAIGRKDGYSYGGCGTQNLLRATSPLNIASAWRRNAPALAGANVTLVAMTNDIEPEYHQQLKEALPNLLFDWELPQLRRVYAEDHDNYLAFQVLRHLAPYAEMRISTARPSCYLRGGCDWSLCDGVCNC